jgi:hypothetical protein
MIGIAPPTGGARQRGIGLLRDAMARLSRRRLIGLSLGVAGFFLLVVGYAASPDRIGLGDYVGVPWAMVMGFVLSLAGDAYGAHQDRSKSSAVGSAIVLAATGAVVALLGLVLVWILSPILTPTSLTSGALVIAEAGLLLAGIGFYLWVQGSSKERRARAIPLAFVGGILAEAGLLRYLPLSQDASSVIAYGLLTLTAVATVWELARRLRRRAGSAETLGGEQ